MSREGTREGVSAPQECGGSAVNEETAGIHDKAVEHLSQVESALGVFGATVESPLAYADLLRKLAAALLKQGRLRDAADCYRQVTVLEPNRAAGHDALGAILLSYGRAREACECCRRAISLDGRLADAHRHLGNALQALGNLEEAAACYREAIALHDGSAEAHNNLGAVLLKQDRLVESAECFRRAIALKPDYAEAHANLATTLLDQEKADEAARHCREALTIKPHWADAHSNFGSVLLRQDRADEAIESCRRAIQLDPACADAHLNLGACLEQQGRFTEARQAYQQAIVHEPDHAQAHLNLAMILLLQGDFAEGWRRYEWRWRLPTYAACRRPYPQPLWDGEDIHGRTILLHDEQGFGDAIQFARYVPMVAGRGGRVVLECLPELKPLFSSLSGVWELRARGEKLPPFDLHCPLMSLPRLFTTSASSIPAAVPYLFAESELSARWRERMTAESDGFRVGLAWAGNPRHPNDRHRSIGARLLPPLARAKHVTFYSLQVAAAAKFAQPPSGMRLVNPAAELRTFADTAALLANLDLVISVDTAVAHLAGAMAKPVWTLLPLAPDWRWMLKRDDSPWYPTMRLFRQNHIGASDEVIDRVSAALAEHAEPLHNSRTA